jgi:Protein of unknown function (DUF3662)/FHA domain
MVLRAIEHKIEALFEGLFGRAFRTNVQPVELARKLSKEMDDHRTVSVSRVYVPNEYTLYLSPADRAQFEGYEASLLSELAEYLAEHAKSESYALLSPPTVLMETDDDLALGEFGIATRMVQPRGRAAQPNEPAAQAAPAHTMIYRPAPPPPAPVAEAEPDLGTPTLRWDGQQLAIAKQRVVLGRSRDCDIQLTDPNVSRRHAELRQEGSSFWIVDLDSTNGIEVNGRRVKRAKLADGDTVILGTTALTFSRERSE